MNFQVFAKLRGLKMYFCSVCLMAIPQRDPYLKTWKFAPGKCSRPIRCCTCFCVFKFWLPKNSLQCVFPVFLEVFGPNLLYREFKNRYSKESVSVNKKDISDHIYQLIYISLWFYCSGFGCQNSSKMTAFRQKMRVLGHNTNSLKLLNLKMIGPESVLEHIRKELFSQVTKRKGLVER